MLLPLLSREAVSSRMPGAFKGWVGQVRTSAGVHDGVPIVNLTLAERHTRSQEVRRGPIQQGPRLAYHPLLVQVVGLLLLQ
jgi:hypothetical protein